MSEITKQSLSDLVENIKIAGVKLQKLYKFFFLCYTKLDWGVAKR